MVRGLKYIYFFNFVRKSVASGPQLSSLQPPNCGNPSQWPKKVRPHFGEEFPLKVYGRLFLLGQVRENGYVRNGAPTISRLIWTDTQIPPSHGGGLMRYDTHQVGGGQIGSFSPLFLRISMQYSPPGERGWRMHLQPPPPLITVPVYGSKK